MHKHCISFVNFSVNPENKTKNQFEKKNKKIKLLHEKIIVIKRKKINKLLAIEDYNLISLIRKHINYIKWSWLRGQMILRSHFKLKVHIFVRFIDLLLIYSIFVE